MCERISVGICVLCVCVCYECLCMEFLSFIIIFILFYSIYWRFMMYDTVVACIHSDAHTHTQQLNLASGNQPTCGASSIFGISYFSIFFLPLPLPLARWLRVCVHFFFGAANLSFRISIIYFVYLIRDAERQTSTTAMHCAHTMHYISDAFSAHDE